MKTLRALFLCAAAIAGAGCGGGGGGGYAPATYVLVQGATDTVPAGGCRAVEGPYPVGNGTMTFQLTDAPTGVGSDNMDISFVSDAIYLSAGCDFAANAPVYAKLGVVDDAGTFSVPADHYDFVVGCNNTVDSCIFQLNWSATY